MNHPLLPPSRIPSSPLRILPLLAWLLAAANTTAPAQTPATAATAAADAGNLETAAPFLTPGRVQGDPLFFVQSDPASPPRATLFQVPSSPPVIRSATLEVTYEAGKDYLWESGSRDLTLPAGSRIPFKTLAALHPAPNTPNSYSAARDGRSWMLFGEGRFFHDLQCAAFYPTAAAWDGPVPAPAPDSQLAAIRKKLIDRQPLKLVTLGDSISTGANASASADAPPRQFGYHELVCAGLQKEFGSVVSGKNLSVGGMDSVWGGTRVPAVLAELPDIVLLAFGMNDASAKRTPEEFLRVTRDITDRLQTARPGCVVILISPMTANPEWSHASPDLYPAYAEVLKSRTGPDCALADVTSIWTSILTKKPYLSLSGNGLNHPNDFGHRLYADTILSTFGRRP
ncbi:MAG: GDSL-like Lipase/Acylhydrolase [Verrucomicrobiales bacterium]|nr:GDSL-like Lipase/Acylhydrolase [Verrucomicrobiales bacterium]